MRGWLFGLGIALCACGRIGFGPTTNGDDTAAQPFSFRYLRPFDTHIVGRPEFPNAVIVGVGSPSEFTVAPALPPGLALDPSTGELSGAPSTLSSRASYTVTARDLAGQKATAQVSLAVLDGFVVNTVTDSSDAQVGDGLCDTDITDVVPSSPCSLRAALEELDALALPRAVIMIPAGRYVVGGAGFVIYQPIVIQGEDSQRVVIDKQGTGNFASNNGVLTLASIAIENGDSMNNDGGAIYAGAPLEVYDSVFRGNRGTRGGAIYGSATVSSVQIWRSQFVDNTSITWGGAIDCTGGNGPPGARFEISDSLIHRNRSTTFGGGGGINAAAEMVFVRNNAILDNFSEGGGGGLHTGRSWLDVLVVENNTIAGNTSNSDGGGVFILENLATLRFNTIVGNTSNGMGGGVAGGGTATLVGNVLARNVAGGVSNSCAGNLTSGGYNVLTLDCSPLAGTGDHYVVDPLIEQAPSMLGGFTPTLGLRAGSPAIDIAPDAICPVQDQRGAPRPVSELAGDHRCDAGAYERQPGP